MSTDQKEILEYCKKWVKTDSAAVIIRMINNHKNIPDDLNKQVVNIYLKGLIKRI